VIDPENIPKKLRMARTGADLSRAEVASRLGVNERTMSSWENGKTDITLTKTLQLCAIYDVSIGELVGDLEYQFALQVLKQTNEELKELRGEIERANRSRPKDL
jgi:transcriptional regulator with XRE-family HTH domain